MTGDDDTDDMVREALEFPDHGRAMVVRTEEVTLKCGNPDCNRDAKYRIDYGLHGMLRCARHLGSMVIFALEDKAKVEVEKL